MCKLLRIQLYDISPQILLNARLCSLWHFLLTYIYSPMPDLKRQHCRMKNIFCVLFASASFTAPSISPTMVRAYIIVRWLLSNRIIQYLHPTSSILKLQTSTAAFIAHNLQPERWKSSLLIQIFVFFFIYLYFYIHQIGVNNKSIHRWGSSRHLNRPYVKGELPRQSPVLSRLLLTNSFPQTYKTNSHQLLLAWQKEGFYILIVELHCELQVNSKFSATQWRKNTQAQDSLMSKIRKQARRGGMTSEIL